jgi:hypothetical protein
LTTPSEPRLPNRFDVEWATERSPLPTVARDVLYALARRMQQGSTVIPLQHAAISLSKLAEASGWSKRHVQRALDYLEKRGIITRRRPSLHDARTKQARTAYVVHYELLLELGPGSPKKAWDTAAYGLGPPRRKPRATQTQGLGSGSPAARDTVAPDQTLSDQPDQSDEIALVIKHLKERTGTEVTREWAAETARLILARPGIGTNRRAYLIRTLVTDPNPQRWLPTPQPPRFTKEEEAS